MREIPCLSLFSFLQYPFEKKSWKTTASTDKLLVAQKLYIGYVFRVTCVFDMLNALSVVSRRFHDRFKCVSEINESDQSGMLVNNHCVLPSWVSPSLKRETKNLWAWLSVFIKNIIEKRLTLEPRVNLTRTKLIDVDSHQNFFHKIS